VREALAARSDRDLMVSSPARRRGGKSRNVGLPRRVMGMVLRRPGESVITILLLGAGAAIAINALVYQTARHPAPIFGPKSAQTELPAPLPPARPAARESIGDLVRAAEPVAPAVRSPVVAVPASKPRDPIGDLIRTGEPATPASKSDPQRLVASGQRALTKLGYGPLKADGVMGAGTRQAIERFERDYRLPVTGEFTPRTVRELSANSGIPVE